MTTDRSRLWLSALGAMVVCLAFLATIVIADDQVGLDPALLAVAPLYLFFIAAPSMVPIAIGRSPASRAAMTVVMVAVAVLAGLRATAIDDGQAGLAVFFIPMVAYPLAGAVRLFEGVADRWRL